MYRLILYNVIFVLIVSIAIVNNCLKGNKKGDKKKPSAKTPITYETDPAVLEKERRMKIKENREKMRKKREKNTNKSLEENKTISGKKVKEMLPEDVTQKTATSEDSVDADKEKAGEKMNKTQPLEDSSTEKPVLDSKLSSDEDLGDIQLVDNDPDAARKMAVIREQAKEAARKKQLAEALERSLRKSEDSLARTPDDTLKNVASIQIESQHSVFQQKKKSDDNVKTGDSTESQMVKEATLIEPKSNPMYLKEFAQHVMRGSAETSGTGN